MDWSECKRLSLEDPEVHKAYNSIALKYVVIEKLIQYRKKHNITQKEFAEIVNLKQQAISRFEKGVIDPRLSFIEKILYIIDESYIHTGYITEHTTNGVTCHILESDIKNIPMLTLVNTLKSIYDEHPTLLFNGFTTLCDNHTYYISVQLKKEKE